MNSETGQSFEQPIKVESTKEVRQITHRDYETYRHIFNLPESSLARINTVVDVGAGLSTFSKEARERFDRLKTIAVDPIYQVLKDNPHQTLDDLQGKEGFILDFNPDYRREEGLNDSALVHQRDEQFFKKFIKEELGKHSSDYIAASHQDMPIADESVDLVLASNSILRSENKPQVIERALQECLRILKTGGEIRVAGGIACFVFNQENSSVELWYNGSLEPGGSWVKELEETGHYSDPKLMEVFRGIEIMGITLHCIIKTAEKDGKKYSRFDTLILRKDNKFPDTEMLDSDEVTLELRKLDFQQTDGFNIPTTIELHGKKIVGDKSKI